MAVPAFLRAFDWSWFYIDFATIIAFIVGGVIAVIAQLISSRMFNEKAPVVKMFVSVLLYYAQTFAVIFLSNSLYYSSGSSSDGADLWHHFFGLFSIIVFLAALSLSRFLQGSKENIK